MAGRLPSGFRQPRRWRRARLHPGCVGGDDVVGAVAVASDVVPACGSGQPIDAEDRTGEPVLDVHVGTGRLLPQFQKPASAHCIVGVSALRFRIVKGPSLMET